MAARIKMKLETWTALAVLGLSVMFVALLLSFYNFLIGPEGEGPTRVVDPGGLTIQLVSISAAPAVVLAGFVFGMNRSYGSRPAGILLIAAGALMASGMVPGLSMLPQIPDQYVVGGVGVVPYIFMPGGAGVAAVGGYLVMVSRRRRAQNLDDLR